MNCATCSNGMCTQCNNNFFLNTAGQCVQTCSAGFWSDSRISDATADQSDWSGTCTACDQGPNACSSCTGPELTDCTGCNDGWFQDGSNGCVQCDSKCATCTGAGSDNCIQCKLSDLNAGTPGFYYLAPSSCYDTCPQGYYQKSVQDVNDPNIEIMTCEQCQDGCTECQDEFNCVTCSRGYMSETVFNQDLLDDVRQCTTCPADCAHCADGLCLECSPNYFMDLTNNNACSASCTVGFYPDVTTNPNTGLCSQCDNACTSCTGQDITTCTGCKDGWFFAI